MPRADRVVVELPTDGGYDALVEQLGRDRFWGKVSIRFKNGEVVRIALLSTYKHVGEALSQRKKQPA